MSGSSVAFPTHLIIDREGNLAVASTGGNRETGRGLAFSLSQLLGRPAGASTAR